MTPSLINPSAAPFFFQAFQAYPETGRMTVPVLMNPLSSAVEEQTLSTRTFVPFARTLGIALSEITSRFARGQIVTSLPGDWSAIHSGPKRLLVENSRQGKAMVFDRGGHLTERLTGHRSGLALAVRDYGLFANLEMAVAINLKHDMRWLPQAYQIKFEACGIVSLKAFLGLPDQATVMDLGLALYHRLDMAAAPDIQTSPMDEAVPESLEIRGATRRGDDLLIRTGLDHASQVYGDQIETLTLDVLPTDPLNQNLPETLHRLWALGRRLAEQFRHDDEETSRWLNEYRRLTLDLYGPPATRGIAN